jgi:hypothetical protein
MPVKRFVLQVQGACSNNCTWTFDLRMTILVFCHCATAACKRQGNNYGLKSFVALAIEAKTQVVRGEVLKLSDKTGAKTFRIMTFSITTLSIMTFSIMTFSITTFSIMILSIMTFSITTFSIMTFSIMILSIMILSIMAFSIMILSIMTFSITTLCIVTFRIIIN